MVEEKVCQPWHHTIEPSQVVIILSYHRLQSFMPTLRMAKVLSRISDHLHVNTSAEARDRVLGRTTSEGLSALLEN
jgi:hypothetical protein